jgi:hypothetical protein
MGRKIGEIADVLMDKEEGRGVDHLGGWIPWNSVEGRRRAVKAIQAIQKNGSWYLTMNATTDALKNAPGYKYDQGAASWVPA